MGYEEHPTSIFEQLVFEPLNQLDIQMIRRLIEEQEVRVTHERSRESDSPLPPPRECPDTRVRRKVEPVDDLIHPLAQTPTITGVYLVLQPFHFPEQGLIISHGLRNMMELCEQSPYLGEPAGNYVKYRRLRIFSEILREPGHREARFSPDITAIRHNLTLNDLEQGRFPCAISPDQANSLAGVDLKRRMRKQSVPTKGNRDVFAGN